MTIYWCEICDCQRGPQMVKFLTSYKGYKRLGICKKCDNTVIDIENRFPKKESVNHPEHYTYGSKEFIDIAKDLLTPEQFKGALLFNLYKYTYRHEKKNGNEDLEKAQWYLNKILENEIGK